MKVGWKVSLSNGETHYEGKGRFAHAIVNEQNLSPWRAMIQYAVENNLKITSMALFTDTGSNYHLPSAGNNPRWEEFSSNGKPNDYKFFRAATNTGGAQVDNFTVAEAVFDKYRLQIWVNTLDPQNSWCVTVLN
jgi:hypothetical protein